MLKVVKEQEEEAAHFVDICVAYAGRDEKKICQIYLYGK